jgi:hypothetical protein
MLQQASLELQFFDGFGKLPCSFGDAPLDFICNPLFLIEAERLLQPDCQLIRSYSNLRAKVLVPEAIIRTFAPAFIVLTLERISGRSMECRLLDRDHQVEVCWDRLVAKVDYIRVRHMDLRWMKDGIRWLRIREFDAF